MRRMLQGLLAMSLLGGCASTLEGMYYEQAREECEQILEPMERSECLDRADQVRRERR